MNFHDLLNRLKGIESAGRTPTNEGGCGMDMMPPAMPPADPKPETPPPSMSVNLNAQGLDNIEQMMKLFTKVNPDMMPKAAEPMPVIAPLPSIKMLPDFDADNDSKIGGEMDTDYDQDGRLDRHEKDHAAEKPLLKSLDRDRDGDHDMADHDAEKKKEAWENEPEEHDYDIDYVVNKLSAGNGDQHNTYPKVAGGDNPMQKVKESDLRAEIRADLQRRLAEAKGAK